MGQWPTWERIEAKALKFITGEETSGRVWRSERGALSILLLEKEAYHMGFLSVEMLYAIT